MHTCLGTPPVAGPRVIVSRAVAVSPASPAPRAAVRAAQANEHYEPSCGTPRYRARPEA
jgi:hypothetical protein